MADGIKYFPLSCSDDDRYDFIEAEFGLKGYAIIVKLHKRIFSGLGYYCEWNDRVSKLFAKNACCGAAPALVQEVVKAAIKENIFDRTMYERYGILTSADIQKTFYNVAKRREVIFDVPEYVLSVPPAISCAADNRAENVCNGERNVYSEGTSRENKSEANKSKAKESKPPSASLAPEKRKLLEEEYGAASVAAYEQRFRRWISDKPSCKADMFETVSRWMSRDKPKGNYRGNSSFSALDIEKLINEKYKSLGGEKDDDND